MTRRYPWRTRLTIAAAVRRALANCSATVPFSPARIRELPPTAISMECMSSVLSSQFSGVRCLDLDNAMRTPDHNHNNRLYVRRFFNCRGRQAETLMLHQFQHDCFLHMQAVLSLLEHAGIRRVDYLIRNLVSTVSRQAVEEDRVRLGAAEQAFVHLERQENLASSVGFALLTHARPNIGIDHVGPTCSLYWIVGQCAVPASEHGAFARPEDSVLLGLVTGRSGDPDVCTQLRAGEHQGMCHVIPVADDADLQAGYIFLY